MNKKLLALMLITGVTVVIARPFVSTASNNSLELSKHPVNLMYKGDLAICSSDAPFKF